MPKKNGDRIRSDKKYSSRVHIYNHHIKIKKPKKCFLKADHHFYILLSILYPYYPYILSPFLYYIYCIFIYKK